MVISWSLWLFGTVSVCVQCFRYTDVHLQGYICRLYTHCGHRFWDQVCSCWCEMSMVISHDGPVVLHMTDDSAWCHISVDVITRTWSDDLQMPGILLRHQVVLPKHKTDVSLSLVQFMSRSLFSVRSLQTSKQLTVLAKCQWLCRVQYAKGRTPRIKQDCMGFHGYCTYSSYWIISHCVLPFMAVVIRMVIDSSETNSYIYRFQML